jgi:hypothetical protein
MLGRMGRSLVSMLGIVVLAPCAPRVMPTASGARPVSTAAAAATSTVDAPLTWITEADAIELARYSVLRIVLNRIR